MGALKRIIEVFHVLLASLPREDYPPKNIADMIKQCLSIDRKDLADQIRMQWVKTYNKYPETRINWGSAVNIGGRSLKKNIFGGKEFVVWLSEQEALSPEEKQAAKEIVSIMPVPKEVPKIAIPKENETAEDWQAAAEETALRLSEARKAFTDVNQFISYLETRIEDLSHKVLEYGPEGAKEKTKEGKTSRLASRVPKWQSKLDVYVAQLKEVKEGVKTAETGFKEAEKSYNNAPITTVEYEHKSQATLDKVLEFILDIDDLEKQKKMLEKFNETLEKLSKKATSKYEINADLWDSLIKTFTTVIDGLKQGWVKLLKWTKGLNKSVEDFNKLASLRYEVEMEKVA